MATALTCSSNQHNLCAMKVYCAIGPSAAGPMCLPTGRTLQHPFHFMGKGSEIIVLVIIPQNRRLTLINTPAALGKGFVPDR